MAGTLLTYVKSLYGLQERSDCDVRFYQGGLQGPPNYESADTWLTAKIPGHLLVLAATSERLRAQADNPWWPLQQQQADNEAEPPTKKVCTSKCDASSSQATQAAAAAGSPPSSAPPGRPLLAVPLEGPHEVEPATHVIRFMYQQELVNGLTTQQLLMTRKLALYLLCTACADACAAALAAAPLIADDAHAVCTNPQFSHMLDDPAMSGFTDACVAALAKHFGSTLALERSDDLKSKFLGLPLPLLQRLMAPNGSGQLPVDCEETVVVLLHRWVLHNDLSAVVKRQLRQLLCLLQLGTVYLHYVLPRLEWLDLMPDEHSDLTYAAQALATAQLTTIASVESDLKRHLSSTYASEPQWLDQRRSSTAAAASSGAGVRQQKKETIRASWTRQELQAMQQEVQVRLQQRPQSPDVVRKCCGPWVYWRGFEWSIQVAVLVKAGGAAGNTGAAAGSGMPATEAGIFVFNRWPGVLGHSKVRCIVNLSELTLQVDAAGEAAPDVRTTHPSVCRSGSGHGWPSYFSHGKGLDPSVWEPFLVEGVLRARAVITK